MVIVQNEPVHEERTSPDTRPATESDEPDHEDDVDTRPSHVFQVCP